MDIYWESASWRWAVSLSVATITIHAIGVVVMRDPPRSRTSATIGRDLLRWRPGISGSIFSKEAGVERVSDSRGGRSCSGHLARRHFALCDLSGLFGKSKYKHG
jgi:hypothetical protein